MSKYRLCFAGASTGTSETSYSLVELPAALAKAATQRDFASDENGLLASLTIKGQPTDEAVLCTSDTTYNVRSVKSSNSLLLCQPSTSTAVFEGGKARNSGKGKSVEVQTTLHQTLELDLAIPKLERISELLKDREWDPEEEETQGEQQRAKRRKIRHYTFEDILDLVPASDQQIEAALQQRRVLLLDSNCRPIAPSTLARLLKNILNTLTLLGMSPDCVLVSDLADSLYTDDAIPRDATRQILGWFGEDIGDGKVKLDMKQIVREMGREKLSMNKNKATSQTAFLLDWQAAVGEEFAELCKLDLLHGLYLATAAKGSLPATILYFPATDLPTDPASRFSELFSVKPKWRSDEMAPFLLDLAVDSKKRDALTLKFTRKFKGDDGQTYFTARGK